MLAPYWKLSVRKTVTSCEHTVSSHHSLSGAELKPRKILQVFLEASFSPIGRMGQEDPPFAPPTGPVRPSYS